MAQTSAAGRQPGSAEIRKALSQFTGPARGPVSSKPGCPEERTTTLDEDTPLLLSAPEKARATVLVVEADFQERHQARNALVALRYGNVAGAPNHAQGVQRVAQRNVTHVLFQARGTNMPPPRSSSGRFSGSRKAS